MRESRYDRDLPTEDPRQSHQDRRRARGGALWEDQAPIRMRASFLLTKCSPQATKRLSDAALVGVLAHALFTRGCSRSRRARPRLPADQPSLPAPPLGFQPFAICVLQKFVRAVFDFPRARGRIRCRRVAGRGRNRLFTCCGPGVLLRPSHPSACSLAEADAEVNARCAKLKHKSAARVLPRLTLCSGARCSTNS